MQTNVFLWSKVMSEKSQIILIVDDEPLNIELIEMILEDDYQLETACTGEEAIEKMKEITPAVILLDIMMPGANGYEICEMIKSNEKFSLTKIILVSGKAFLEERIKGYDSGANDYLTKPFAAEELQAKVKVFYDLYMAEKKLIEFNSSLEKEVQVRTDQLFKSEKMALIGMHSAEIVHNLRNPLCLIQSYASLIKSDIPEHEKYGKKIMKAGDKLSDIITSILSTTKISFEDEKKDFDLNDLIEASLEQFDVKNGMGSTIEIIKNFNELPLLNGVENHFYQIIGNLISNAVDAMFESEKKALQINTASIGQKIFIKISDTGMGISKDHYKKIFEPLFSTKSKDGKNGEPKGTGLGLASCVRMIESYGGKLTVESELGVGTSFTIEIPVKNVEERLSAA